MVAAWIISGEESTCLKHGITGRELLKPVVGFQITNDGTKLTGLENISAVAEFRCVEKNNVFVLMDGELLTQLHFCMGNDVVIGIRFVTNLRTSQWFGAHQKATQTSIVSSSGAFIHSICWRAGVGRCVAALGAVIWPRDTDATSATTSVAEERPQQDRCVLEGERALLDSTVRSVVSEVGGVLIKLKLGYYNTNVAELEVLSKTEYSRFVALQDHVTLPANEFVEVILPDELIIGVEFSHTVDYVTAVRFETTRRTTPWFGGAVSGSSYTSFRCDQDETICGFFSSPMDSVGLGVVTVAKRP